MYMYMYIYVYICIYIHVHTEAAAAVAAAALRPARTAARRAGATAGRAAPASRPLVASVRLGVAFLSLFTALLLRRKYLLFTEKEHSANLTVRELQHGGVRFVGKCGSPALEHAAVASGAGRSLGRRRRLQTK